MLTVKQNLLETIHGGNPDRFVNQYEFLKIIYGSPFFDLHNGPVLEPGVINAKNAWGITFSWPEGLPGEFPVHDEEHLVLKDVTQWRDHVHAPGSGLYLMRSGRLISNRYRKLTGTSILWPA